MTIPAALAAAATGAGGAPAVVFPSVNMTITFAFVEAGSNSSIALVKASAWLVEPPAAVSYTHLRKSQRQPALGGYAPLYAAACSPVGRDVRRTGRVGDDQRQPLRPTGPFGKSGSP